MSKTVAVLMGGWSSERPVSLSSGNECANALERAGYTVKRIDLERDMEALLNALDPQPDVVFNALHGPYGEDGCVQGLLNMLGIPYTHSGLLASAMAMDKPVAIRLFQSVGIKCPEHVVVTKQQVLDGAIMAPPYVIKPINEGSSFGVEIVEEDEGTPPFDADDWPYGDTVMVERFIPGRELTVSVMGDRALAVTEIRPREGFYDYEAKYTDGRADHLIPAPIPADVEAEAKRTSVVAHDVLGCRGVSRADFRYDEREDGVEGLYMLEVNTQPGMTPLSLVPEQATHVGISFEDLVSWMVERATCDS